MPEVVHGTVQSPDRAIDHFSAGVVDRLGSRVKGTVYQAGTTALAVYVSGTMSGATSRAQLEISVDNFASAQVCADAGRDALARFNLHGIVPPNWYYRVTEAVVTITLDQWRECTL